MIRTEGPVWTPATAEKAEIAGEAVRGGEEISYPVTVRLVVKRRVEGGPWVAACLPLGIFVARWVKQDAIDALVAVVRERLK